MAFLKEKKPLEELRSDLKPCPFCGSEAVLFVKVPKGRIGRRIKYRAPMYVVGCSDPFCILYCSPNGRTTRLLFKTGSGAFLVEKWNRRLTATSD